MSKNKIGNVCYSQRERAWMEGTQEWRAKWLHPLLAMLSLLGIRANHVTFLSFLFGVSFLPLWFCISPVAAFVALMCHIPTDGVDGALARHQGTASGRGSFTDTVAGQCIVTLVTLTTMKGGLVSVEAGKFNRLFRE